MTTSSNDTAVQARIEDAFDSGGRADAQVGVVLGRVLAQRRSGGTALDYVRGLSPGVKANCWQLAEAAGHENPYRMQALLRTYRWDWTRLRAELPALAGARWRRRHQATARWHHYSTRLLAAAAT